MRQEEAKAESGSGLRRKKAVFLLGGDREDNDAITDLLTHDGIRVEEFSDFDGLMSAEPPAEEVILVVDLQALSADLSVRELLQRLDGAVGSNPDLVCIAHSRDLPLRLEAMRAGALAYHVAPISPDELTVWLVERSGQGPSDPYRVLVVDDQAVAATFASRVLDAAGMKTRVLLNPFGILDELADFNPDLVLMDVMMPGVTGIELASVISEQDEFFRIPVVFLSKESRPEHQVDALRHGGEDFLMKPVEPRRLVEVVERRIQIARSRNTRGTPRPDLDPGSNLYNRRCFLKRLNRALVDDTTQKPGNGLLYIDLDSPKTLIERIGRGCVDGLIAHMGHLIRGCLSPMDMAGRIGEFGFGLLARRSEERGLADLAEHVRASFAQQEAIGGRGAMTVSVGIGRFRPRADDALTMISRAKKSCAKARAQGGNRVFSYVPLVPAPTAPDRDDSLTALVEWSLRSGGLQLMYQPIVAMRNLAGRRYEALLRLRAPDGEYIPTFDFLPIAHARGLMPGIDCWVMEHALDRLRYERRQRQRGLRFFVHQTMESAASDGWVAWLRDQIAERDLIKVRPLIQFQVQDVMDHRDLALERARELHRLGIRICLIQFEENHDALVLIEEMPVSMVKLSMETIKKASTGELTNLVAGLHAQKTAVIAPGIDGPSSIAHLWGCGVDFIQGNFLQFPAEDLGFDFSESALR